MYLFGLKIRLFSLQFHCFERIIIKMRLSSVLHRLEPVKYRNISAQIHRISHHPPGAIRVLCCDRSHVSFHVNHDRSFFTISAVMNREYRQLQREYRMGKDLPGCFPSANAPGSRYSCPDSYSFQAKGSRVLDDIASSDHHAVLTGSFDLVTAQAIRRSRQALQERIPEC